MKQLLLNKFKTYFILTAIFIVVGLIAHFIVMHHKAKDMIKMEDVKNGILDVDSLKNANNETISIESDTIIIETDSIDK